MTGETCRIVLVRHGETAPCDVVPGHRGCPGLSTTGRSQAQSLANRLERSGELGNVAAVYSSRIRRSIETAEAVVQRIGGSLVEDCDFCELHDGEADGLPIPEAVDRLWRPASGSSRHLPWNGNAADAESFPQLVARAAGGLHRLVLEHPGQTVLVFTHGGVIQSSFMCFGDASFRYAMSLAPAQTSLTEWLVPVAEQGERHSGPDAVVRPARLLSYNDTGHL